MSIEYEVILGPSILDIVSRDKRLRRIFLVVSKEETATMFISTSNEETGDFTAEKEVAAGELDLHKIPIPIAQGISNAGYCFRIKIRGVGKAQLHEIVPELVARG